MHSVSVRHFFSELTTQHRLIFLTRRADELIRQVTINCSERGMLLLRVRDEIRMTIAAYQTLYESSIAFGMRKALMAEQRKAELESKIKQLELDNEDLEKQVANLKQKCSTIEKRETERRDSRQESRDREVRRLVVPVSMRTSPCDQSVRGAGVSVVASH